MEGVLKKRGKVRYLPLSFAIFYILPVLLFAPPSSSTPILLQLLPYPELNVSVFFVPLARA
jgi:hypothetical protein